MSSEKNAAKVIRRLRNRIVVMVAASTAVVAVIAFAAILAVTYTNSYSDIMRSLVRACMEGPTNQVVFSIVSDGTGAGSEMFGAGEGGDAFEAGDPDSAQLDDTDGRGEAEVHKYYLTSYTPAAVFVVDGDGHVLSSNAEVVTMDETARDAAIAKALAAAKPKGRLTGIGLFFAKMQSPEGTVIAFHDSSALDAKTRSSALLLLVASFALILAMVAVGEIVARFITRPVQRAWDQQAKFIADASHELKTPLTVLIANNDIMMSHPEFTAEERMTWLEGTRVEARHMRALIEDMLTLARGEQVEWSAPRDMPLIDLSTIVERSSLAFEAVAFDRGVRLQEVVSPGIRVHGDEESLERMVKTLVDNAVKYAGKDGSATVELRAGKGGRPALVVNNSGEPIAKEDLPHVFDRFWRGSEARERSSDSGEGGFGLGLSIAHNIAEQHGTKMCVRSDEEHGTTFTVEF